MASFEHVTFLLVVMSMTSLILAIDTRAPSSEITLQGTPSRMHVGLTRDLCMNCSFVPQTGSNINVIISLILSKTSGDDQFTELAAVTSSSHNNVFVKNSLGANVTGSIMQGQESHLSFCWIYPSDQVPGEYRCDVSGVDNFGHPISVSAMSEIKETTVDNGVLLDKLREVEILLYNQNKQLLDAKAKLHDLQLQAAKEKAQLQLQMLDLQIEAGDQKSQIMTQEGQINTIMDHIEKSRIAITEYSTYFKNHKYHLTRLLWRNTVMVDSLCALYGGYLVEVDDVAEFDFLHDFLKNNSVTTDVMVSGTKEGHPTWTYERSHQNMTYFNWAPSEPGDAACVYIDQSQDWKMSDTACRVAGWMKFICEVPI